MAGGGRTAGKYGYSDNSYYSSHSYKSINDEIILVSIIMGITILVLITIALCYIAYEKCQKKREYYINA
ncbi:GL12517 [Drosophila persimilis]|uniref:Uncharacterized protein n=3 Tax=obscura group TaxID=32355 RepID=A0A6I8USA5_DROPS|nr:uncharacterized protein LOC4803065 [Drosophila pseudoobscura]XP_002019668.1 uncharacterized protein LOC6594209 [Drosophila persimilis]XP_017145126.1 uncharacterized protein LOC108157534 [Drosophila miranda]XP_022209869.1 uncharacterized protein LOC111065785 [Drosophila obscura]XP_026850372.1 uncharacterized protein LOC6594209 [Drosophila persimilis]XP_034132045.1 uncharacterized protein LOC117586215 [Drosophila guanche]XP_034661103.1 uncharacterized protein LOC117896746 [Drosophila subobsc